MNTTELETKTSSKWKSRRWLITVWAMFMVTAIVISSEITKSEQWNGLATTLVAIPVAFTSLESLNKKHKYKGEEK